MSKAAEPESFTFIDFIFLTFFVLILFALLFVGIMYKIRDYNIRKKNFTLKPSSFQVGYYFSEIQKSNLATFAEGVITLIVICITGVIPVYVIGLWKNHMRFLNSVI
jgi:hypothetical protein